MRRCFSASDVIFYAITHMPVAVGIPWVLPEHRRLFENVALAFSSVQSQGAIQATRMNSIAHTLENPRVCACTGFSILPCKTLTCTLIDNRAESDPASSPRRLLP